MPPTHKTGSTFKMDFALSKRHNFHRAYLVTVSSVLTPSVCTKHSFGKMHQPFTEATELIIGNLSLKR